MGSVWHYVLPVYLPVCLAYPPHLPQWGADSDVLRSGCSPVPATDAPMCRSQGAKALDDLTKRMAIPLRSLVQVGMQPHRIQSAALPVACRLWRRCVMSTQLPSLRHPRWTAMRQSACPPRHR